MINIIAVGKLSKLYNNLICDYLKRLSLYTRINIIEINEYKQSSDSESDILKVKDNEGKKILDKCKGFIVALDSKGEEFTSIEFADFIRNKQIQGVSSITFIIGGSHGLSEEVIRNSDFILSFGQFTYPHQLMRVIFVEQLYRAYSILANSKYHK